MALHLGLAERESLRQGLAAFSNPELAGVFPPLQVKRANARRNVAVIAEEAWDEARIAFAGGIQEFEELADQGARCAWQLYRAFLLDPQEILSNEVLDKMVASDPAVRKTSQKLGVDTHDFEERVRWAVRHS